MPTPPLLISSELDDALRGLPEWSGDTSGISRTAECGSFPAAVAVVDAVAVAAEAADHHPDIDIRWRTLRFALTTHDAGGVTSLDLDLAGQIDAAVAEHG